METQVSDKVKSTLLAIKDNLSALSESNLSKIRSLIQSLNLLGSHIEAVETTTGLTDQLDTLLKAAKLAKSPAENKVAQERLSRFIKIMEERLSDIQLERLSVSSTLSKAIGLVKEKLAKVPNLKLLLDNLKNLGLEVESMLNMKGLYKTMLEESAEKGGLMKNMGRFLFWAAIPVTGPAWGLWKRSVYAFKTNPKVGMAILGIGTFIAEENSTWQWQGILFIRQLFQER